MNFRKTVYEKLGYKKGNLNKALIQAIDLWLEYNNGTEPQKQMSSKPKSKIKKIVEDNTKLNEDSKIEFPTLLLDKFNHEKEYRNLSFDELYKKYEKLKDLTDPNAVKICGTIIRILNEMLERRSDTNLKTKSTVASAD